MIRSTIFAITITIAISAITSANTAQASALQDLTYKIEGIIGCDSSSGSFSLDRASIDDVDEKNGKVYISGKAFYSVEEKMKWANMLNGNEANSGTERKFKATVSKLLDTYVIKKLSVQVIRKSYYRDVKRKCLD